jgi:GT2 family glycosyltransferase/glycosyltransferase involved in cell wall biosynthesis
LGDTEIDIVHYEWPESLTNFDPGFGKKQIFRYMEAVSLRYLMELSGIAPHTAMWVNKFLEILHYLPVELIEAAVLDARIAVTNKDAEFFHNLYPHQPFYVINPGISLDDYSLPEVTPEPHSMIFTGYFTHSPNIDAVHFFFEEIWPGVCSQVPDARIYIVGDGPSEYLTNLADGKQIIVTGRVQDIRPYIQKASIGIAPLISGAGIRIKVMEYAALRRACVATSIATTDLMLEAGKDYLLANTAEDFIRNIVSLLTDDDLNRRMANSAYEAVRKNHDFRSSAEYHTRLYDLLEQPAAHPEVAVRQQVEDRAGQVDRWLAFYEKRAQMLGRPESFPGSSTLPLVSILILTFNNLQVSKLCLTSLYCNTRYPNFEVIVVDNASSDETPAWLVKFAETHANFKYILNTENRGFAAGNNQAAALAAGDYLVFLNNDTVVTNGWIEGLLHRLEADSTIGIVGPVTNAIGNEARIETNYKTPVEMEALAAWRARYLADKSFEIGVLAFYCVMARRNEYLAFGGLDERFGLGLFEDVDMADQVRRAGQHVLCVEDVFIHHFHRASFGKIEESVYDVLFETNQKLFEEKWAKKWEPFKYRLAG